MNFQRTAQNNYCPNETYGFKEQYYLNFVTCTEHKSGWTNIGNLENAPYYQSNDTYDVTNHVFGGSGYEIWKTLQSDLNFTSSLYKRKEAKYGIPMKLKNGSLQISDGYLNDIYRGKADVFARQFTIMYDRHLFIDFLQPIEKSKVGIFVKSNDLVEGFDIEVFFRPFENWTWMAVTLSSLLISICIITLWKILNQTSESFLFGIKVFAMSIQANLGKVDGTVQWILSEPIHFKTNTF